MSTENQLSIAATSYTNQQIMKSGLYEDDN